MAPGGSRHFIENYVGETINLSCESVCGNFYWFVNDERVIAGNGVHNASVIMNSRCVNENNTCSHESHIDCQETYNDGRFLLSELTIVPTAEDSFLIECEADLCGVELRKSVMLTAKGMLDCMKKD